MPLHYMYRLIFHSTTHDTMLVGQKLKIRKRFDNRSKQ